MPITFDAGRWTAGRDAPVQPKRGPSVPKPTAANTSPYQPATTVSLAGGSQYDAVRRQISASGLNDAAQQAVEQSYAGIDAQRSRGRRYRY
jgi:hypothetical protein